mgnify:CR=1 FL=1
MKKLISSKNCFVLSLALCLGLSAQAQTVFYTEDFETDGQGSRYTASTPFNDGSADHWNRTDGSDIGNATGAYSSYSGTYFWAAEDTDDNGGNGVDDQTLDITGIDIQVALVWLLAADRQLQLTPGMISETENVR